MIAKMHRIRENPLVAMRLGDEEFKRQEIEKKHALELAEVRGRKKGFLAAKKIAKPKVQADPMETVILESTLIKLGSLLAVGFGRNALS